MIDVKIHEVTYRVSSDWSDITIDQAASLLNLKMPDSLKAVYDIAMKPGELSPDQHAAKVQEVENAISLQDQHKNIPRYFSHVIEVLSNIPANILKQTDVNSIKTLYHMYLKQFVEGVHFFPVMENKDISHFEFDGVKYWLPTDKVIFGQKVPMVDVTALEFAESADLMIYMTKLSQERDFTRAANMIAILCRPEGEPYDESTALLRAEQFKSLTMDIVWNVFFSLITPLVIANQYVQISFLEGLAKEKAVMN